MKFCLMRCDVTLRTRLVMLVVAAILPLFGFAVLGAVLTANHAVNNTSKNLTLSAALVAANQERVADSARQVLIAIANTPQVLETRGPECRGYFEGLTRQLSAYTNFGVIAADGQVLCDSRSDKPDVFEGDRSYFKTALASRQFVVGEMVAARPNAKASIVFALPVLNPQGAVSALVFASMGLSELADVISSASLPSGGSLVVTDSQGNVLVSNPDDLAAIGRPLSNPLLQAAFHSKAAGINETSDSSGRRQIFAYRPSADIGQSAFFVAVGADMHEVTAQSRWRLMKVFLALILVSVLGSYLAWQVGKRSIVLPAAKILDAAGRLQTGQRDVRIDTRDQASNSEMTHIAQGFNRMAQALEHRERELETELALSRQTEQKLRDAQRLGHIGNWEFDIGTQKLWWSDEVYSLLGVSPDNFDGRHESLVRMVHPDDQAPYLQARENAIAGNNEFDVEYRLIKPAGDVIWVHQWGRPVFDDAGKLVSRTGIIQEITARKGAELTVARHVELMNRTGDMARIGGWELLLDRNILVCSDQVYRIQEVEPAGYTPLATAIGFYAPEAQPEIEAAIRAGIDFGTPWDLVLPLVTATGRRVHVRVQGMAQRKDGKTQRLVGAMQDVTEQVEAQAHLTLLETALSRLNDIVLITEAEPFDEPGPRIVYVNDAFERRTGYRREEVIGRSPRILQGPGTDRVELARIGQALRKWEPVRSEIINYKKGGEAFWLDMQINPIAHSKGCFTHWVAVERDITQRKHAEQALNDSEQRYTALFAQAPVPMWVYDVETFEFLTVNEAAVSQYGYSLEAFLTMTLFDIRPETERESLKHWLSQSNRSERLMWQHQRKDGTVFPVKVLSRPVQYNNRDARFVLALDRTAQVKAEKDVQEYLLTLQRATDAAQAITFHQTLDGTMREVVEQARGVIGAHQAVVTLSASDGVQAIHAVSLSEKYSDYRDRLEPIHGSGILGMVCGNNRTVRMTQAELEAHPGGVAPGVRGCLAVPLIGRNNKNIGMLQLSDRYEGDFTIQDEYVAIEMAQLVSIAIENAQLLEQVNQLNAGLEKKVAERTAALSRQEALFRALAEQAPQVVWTADPDGNATFANRAWFDLVGGEFKDWCGKKWFKAVHPDDLEQVKTLWRTAMKTRQPYVGIRRLRARDDSYHTMSYRTSPVYDEQGEVMFWVGIDADISEIKAIETALRLSNQELEAFSYSVSHDLRSPLNTIDGFSRLLAKQLAPTLDEKGKHYLARVQSGVAQMGQLIEDLLSLAQVSRAPLRAESVDLTALAQSIMSERRANSPDRDVSVTIEENLQTVGDGRLLRVVLENLLSNAWKFTARVPEAAIIVGQVADAAGVPVFFVKDNGAGFDMAYADKLFTAFQRLHTAAEFPGTGIGLATASRVIVRHGGRLWADASFGKGATFFFTVPRLPTVVEQ